MHFSVKVSKNTNYFDAFNKEAISQSLNNNPEKLYKVRLIEFCLYS